MGGKNVVTIDGPAGSGKSTIGRLLAGKMGWLYLDTGAMYRALALAASRDGIAPDDGDSLGKRCQNLNLHFEPGDPPRLLMADEDISTAIRSPEMDMLSSRVSSVSQVRRAMTALQRKMALKACLIAEGRDMGTVVFPRAACKFFLTASPRVRAERRYRERKARGETASLSEVEANLVKRDHQDRTRSLAPLVPAEDAHIIDTSSLTIEEVVHAIFRRIPPEHEKTRPER